MAGKNCIKVTGGLTDVEEVLKYNTDPLSEDTDGDKLLDVDENNLGIIWYDSENDKYVLVR